MDLKLDGKRALVTGASSGIGVEIARVLAEEGALVVVGGRDRERTEHTVREIEAAGGRAAAAVGEVTTDEGAETVASAAIAAFGGVDILVNNAGGGGGQTVRQWDEIPLSNWFDSYNLNVASVVRMAHLLVPGMIERGWGRVINISTAMSRQSLGMMHDYAASKIAQESVSLNLSQNIARHGVTVNTVIPGVMLTARARKYLDNVSASRGWSQAEREARYVDEFAPQAVKRLGKPEEIATAVVFLASPLSDYTTNAVLRVDGGMSRYL